MNLKLIAPVFIASLVACSPSFSQISDNFKPQAFVRYINDDNLFRDSTNEQADSIVRIGAAVDIGYSVSRQDFIVKLKADRANYDKNDSLDHDDLLARGLWNWVVGSRLNGVVDLSYLETIASFDEDAARTKDDKTRRSANFNADYELTPQWDLRAGISTNQIRVDQRPSVDLDQDSFFGEVRYVTGARTRVGLRSSKTDGDYLNLENVNGVLVNNDFEKTELSVTLYWEGTGKSSFRGRVGWTDVKFEDLSDRDFDGRSARLTYLWDISGKSDVDITYWNEARPRSEVSSIVVTQGVHIKPRWEITEKLSASLNIIYEDIDYEGDANRIVGGSELRADDVKTGNVSLSYRLPRIFTFSLAYTYSDRESNNPPSNFEYSRWDAAIGARF